MLSGLSGAVVRAGIGGLQRRLRKAVFLLVALFLVVLAVTFGFVALYLWLATRVEPWQAALIVGAILLVAALILWLASRSGSAPAARNADARIQASLDEASRALKTKEGSLTALAGVLAVGFAIGRRLSK